MEKDTTALDVSPQFIEENQAVFKKKRGGPYTSYQRSQRREKVCQLHFEQGHSALAISKILGIDRNTINADIRFWYCQLAREWNNTNIESLFMKQLKRLESQRARLVEQLGRTDKISDEIAIERLILDIDTKIAQMATKMASAQDLAVNKSVQILNKHAQKNGLDLRFVNSSNIIQLNSKAGQKVLQMIQKSRR